jgi:hypothetical protein
MAILKPFFLIVTLCVSLVMSSQNRTLDGSENNLSNPTWGAAGQELNHLIPTAYSDGISSPSLTDSPNARELSNLLFEQNENMPDLNGLSDFCWTFGQFVDHDIILVHTDENESITVDIPTGDPHFDPMGTGNEQFIISRSEFDPATGTDMSNPRININSLSSWIDASGIYGSDTEHANWLRAYANSKLITSEGNMLPFNTFNGNYDHTIDPNAPAMIIEGMPLAKFYVSGDLRANEQPTLIAMHTLFHREHNRRAELLDIAHPGWTDEEIYQRARKEVGALIAHITYNEYLPALGLDIGPYAGYDDDIYPNVMNSFSSAAFRIGHTQINESLIRLDNLGDTISFGSIDLKDCFFMPQVVHEQGGISPFLQGAATQTQQAFDTRIIGDLRNFMFGAPGEGGMDLATINITRGRERGLPDFNTLREELGLTPFQSFDEVCSDPLMVLALEEAYVSIEKMDAWVGMLSEDMLPGTSLGETMETILSMQFENLREGDRFFYLNDPAFTVDEITELEELTLADVIRLNTDITLIQDQVFYAEPFDQLVSVDEEHVAASMTVYPNPSADQVKVSWQNGSAMTIAVTSLLGEQLIHEDKMRSGSMIDLSALSAGVYVMTLSNENGLLSTSRVLKN